MKVTSSAFQDGSTIPKKCTCDGEDTNPPLTISEIPSNAKSVAIICDDPDAPVGIWVHWVLFNIEPTVKEISPNFNEGTKGKNDFRRLGYGGPCPPPGPAHNYRFKVYALDKMLTLKEGASKAELEKAMEGHTLAFSQINGKYGRKM